MFNNFCCRKCGRIIAIESERPTRSCVGFFISNKIHDCPEGLADDEKALCELISYSDSLLENTYEAQRFIDEEHTEVTYCKVDKNNDNR